jgi:hypothetical protein
MRYHAERGNDRWQGLWGPRGGLKTRSVSGRVTTQSVGTISGRDSGARAADWRRGASREALPRGAWERSVAWTLGPARRIGDAERLGMRYHAEHGNDRW